MQPFRTRTRLAVLGTAAAVGIGLFAGLGPMAGGASSHREAPLIAADPQADNTDLYAFVSPDNPSSVTIISNWIPFEAPAGGPNFFAFGQHVRYDVKIDNDADAKPDTIYRWTFHNHYRNPDSFLYNTGPVTSLDDTDLNFYQTYDVERLNVDRHTARTIVHDATVVPSRVGDASMPNYTTLRNEGIVTSTDGSFFAGQADDPFFADLRVFDLLYGGDLSETGNDTLADYNVNTFALQVPKAKLAKGGNEESQPDRRHLEHRLATRRRAGPGCRSRGWACPLVNEVVIPAGQEGRVERVQADERRTVPALRDRSRGRPTDRRGLRDPRAGDPAQRSGQRVPDRRRRAEHARRRGAERGAPAEHVDRSVHERVLDPRRDRRRQRRASRTDAGSPTTSWTWRSRSSKACSSARTPVSVTASTRTTRASAARSRTSSLPHAGSSASA